LPGDEGRSCDAEIPALVREGMTALALGSAVSEDDSRLARTVFEAVGRVVLVEERLMDAVTD